MFFKNPFKKEKTTLWTLPAPTGKVRRLEGAVLAGQSLQSVQAHFSAQAEERPVSARQDVPAAAALRAFPQAEERPVSARQDVPAAAALRAFPQAEERPVSAKQDVPAAALSLAFSKADALDIGIAALARLSGLNKAERAFFAREK